MTKSASLIHHVSDTAFWMASYRAIESERPDALFRDPLAARLVGERGKKISDSMVASARYSYWTLVIRTCVIDKLISDHVARGCTTIVNLGAGLDTRPYRLALPSSARWVEMDFPGIIELKNTKLAGEKPACALERIAVDLSDRAARQKAFAELDARLDGPAVVLTEGVIPYLTEELVMSLGHDLAATRHFKYWVGEYYSKRLYRRFQSGAFRKALGDSPFQFFPDDWFGVFERSGWKKNEVRYLYDEGERLGRPFPLPWAVRVLRKLVGGEAIARGVRLQAFVVFEKAK